MSFMIQDVPESYHPLRSTTVQISFFHIRRSCARRGRFCPLRPHQSLISSSHFLHGRPLRDFPSIFANYVCFINQLSSILHMCPNSLSFRFLIMSITVSSVAIVFRMSSFLIIFFELIINILRSHFISNASSFFLSVSFQVHVSQA